MGYNNEAGTEFRTVLIAPMYEPSKNNRIYTLDNIVSFKKQLDDIIDKGYGILFGDADADLTRVVGVYKDPIIKEDGLYLSFKLIKMPELLNLGRPGLCIISATELTESDPKFLYLKDPYVKLCYFVGDFNSQWQHIFEEKKAD